MAFVHVVVDELQGTALALDLEDLPAPLLRKVIAKRDRFDRAIRQIVRQGMDEGLFRQGDPKLLTFAILGAMNWIPRWFNPTGTAQSDEIGEAFADFVLGGLISTEQRSLLRAAKSVTRGRKADRSGGAGQVSESSVMRTAVF